MKVINKDLNIVAEMESHICENAVVGGVRCGEHNGIPQSYLVMYNGILIDGWEKYEEEI